MWGGSAPCALTCPVQINYARARIILKRRKTGSVADDD